MNMHEIVNPLDLTVALNQLSELDLEALAALACIELERRIGQRRANAKACRTLALVESNAFSGTRRDREPLPLRALS